MRDFERSEGGWMNQTSFMTIMMMNKQRDGEFKGL